MRAKRVLVVWYVVGVFAAVGTGVVMALLDYGGPWAVGLFDGMAIVFAVEALVAIREGEGPKRDR